MEEEQILHMDEINIRTVFRDLMKNLLIIILAACTALMGVRIYRNMVYVPQYTSSTTMAVMAKGNADGGAYSSLSTASSMAEVFTEVFQSDIMREKVAEAIGEVPSGVSITPSLIQETNLLVLNVTANDPQTAYKVLQAVLDNYRYVSDYLFGNAVLEVIMDPQVPTAPSNYFNTTKLDAIAVLGSVVLVCGLIVVFSVFRKTVKTTKSARRNLEGKCLVTLPYEEKNRTFKEKLHKTNKGLILGSKVLNFEYEESCHELAAVVERMMRRKEKQTLLVTSVAENEGKSTVAVNMATALAKRNKRVLLVDMDFRKPALHKLVEKDIQHTKSFHELVKENAPLKSLVQFDKKQHIYVIMNGQSITDCQKSLDVKVLQRWLHEAEQHFDYVIVDSAPISAGTDTEYLKDFLECSLLVVRQDIVDIADINDTIEMLDDGKSEFLGYVLNAFHTSGKHRTGRYGQYNGYAMEAGEE